MLDLEDRMCPSCEHGHLHQANGTTGERTIVVCNYCGQCFGEESAGGTLIEALAELDCTSFSSLGGLRSINPEAYSRRLLELQALQAACEE